MKTRIMTLLSVILITAGVTKWINTAAIVGQQEVAAQKYLQVAMVDEELAPGLTNSPKLLEIMYLAVGERLGIESCILMVAGGLVAAVIAFFWFQHDSKRRRISKSPVGE